MAKYTDNIDTHGNTLEEVLEGTVPADWALQDTPVVLAVSAAADDIIDTATPHGYAAGEVVTFPTLTGGTGLLTGRFYFVIAANLAAQTFQVSETPGGAAKLFSADITAGTVATLDEDASAPAGALQEKKKHLAQSDAEVDAQA